jgi:hypothetical protein
MSPTASNAPTPDAPTPGAPTSGAPTRRTVLVTGAVGLAASAFLAACGKSDTNPGQSGTPISTTSTIPPVPTTEPSADALEMDQALFRTASSLELLVAETYGKWGPKLGDTELRSLAFRFQGDHTDAAAVFSEASTEEDERTDKPNEYLEENLVGPAADGLVDDGSILDLMAGLESTLAATYVTAAGTFTGTEWRQKVMTFGGASARRSALLANGGAGSAPEEALFPVNDLIPNAAYLLDAAATKAAG